MFKDSPGFIVLKRPIKPPSPLFDGLSPIMLLPVQQVALMQATKLMKARPSLVPPVFLTSQKATDKYLDSLRKSISNDPFENVDALSFDRAAVEANAIADADTQAKFDIESIGYRIDLINQMWTKVTSESMATMLGDVSASSLPDILAEAMNMPEFKITAALFWSVPSIGDDKYRLLAASICLSYGENNFDRNATAKGSSARGIFATTNAAVTDGLKVMRNSFPSNVVNFCRLYYLRETPDARFGADVVIAGAGVILMHHRQILNDWNFTEDGWKSRKMEKGHLAVQGRYATLLNDEFIGYMWLQTVYHYNGSPAIIQPDEKRRIDTDLAMASVIKADFDLFKQKANLDVATTAADAGSVSTTLGNRIAPSAATIDGNRQLLASIASAASPEFIDGQRVVIRSRWQKLRTYYNQALKRMVSRPHRGIDIRARFIPIFSPAEAIVAQVSNEPKGFGNYVVLNVPSFKAHYRFAHLSKTFCRKGDKLNPGQIFSISGDSGNAKGAPHIHFEYMPYDAIGNSESNYPTRANPTTDPHKAFELIINS